MKYCRAYREYEQRYGKPYQSPCEANQRSRVLLQNFRRLGLLIDKAKQLAHLAPPNLIRYFLIASAASPPARQLLVKLFKRKILKPRKVHNVTPPNDQAHRRLPDSAGRTQKGDSNVQ
jgi:hypothetical protein